MFAPTKVWRKWHVKVNQGQRRFATASALAASSVAPLVQARGHRVSSVPELPLVVADSAFSSMEKTRAAVALLKSVGAYTDVVKVSKSKKLRAGKGKLRAAVTGSAVALFSLSTQPMRVLLVSSRLSATFLVSRLPR